MFRKPELLTVAEGNGWKPEKNAAPVDAEKGARLKEQGLPSVLQLHLKRFQYDWQTQTMTKVNTPWSFPLILDLYPLLVANENATEPCSAETALYDLQSVVLHVGDYESGHYYSYVRPDVTKHNCWYRFNDDQVERVDVRQVLQDAFGGARAINVDKGGEEMEDFAANTSNNIWSWWRRQLPWLFPTSAARSEHSFGYGGLTSNAYVLQYIRRRDIPLLYQPKKPDSCPGKSKL
jgi:ubiquitin carboxyl-terminal hydrolase 7